MICTLLFHSQGSCWIGIFTGQQFSGVAGHHISEKWVSFTTKPQRRILMNEFANWLPFWQALNKDISHQVIIQSKNMRAALWKEAEPMNLQICALQTEYVPLELSHLGSIRTQAPARDESSFWPILQPRRLTVLILKRSKVLERLRFCWLIYIIPKNQDKFKTEHTSYVKLKEFLGRFSSYKSHH